MANEAVAYACGGGGDEAAISSPKGIRIKFLCSYGGKILPRHTDGQLKYVGGETRVIGVPRHIKFSELMKKLTSEVEGDMVLKYQLTPEDLDVLVSVRNDEDLKHMLEEYDRHETGGTTKFRAYLFPATPIVLENQNAPPDPHVVENRYIDAINNTVRANPNSGLPSVSANRPTFSISASSSPSGNSPESNTDHMLHEQSFKSGYHNSRLGMHKVHSSPSLYNLGSHHHQSSNHGSHYLYQQQQQHLHQHHQQQQQQHQHQHSSQSARPPHEPHRMTPLSLSGQQSFGRAPLIPPNQYHSNVHSIGSSNIHNWNSSSHNMGSGNSNKYGYYDEHSAYGCRGTERFDSLPTSPRNKILE
ncbi:Octicosapeptide/Phox/Bem1p family protein [Euphorbia peplus]|nr:Octicosapeptide/Phox/Bem1p family protein [Euphorbia peplus]